MFNKHEIARDACQLFGGQAKCGYDWWWHSFTARNEKTPEKKSLSSSSTSFASPQAAEMSPYTVRAKKAKRTALSPLI